MIYWLGRRFKFVRWLYWKINHGNWMWGIYTFVNDNKWDDNITNSENSTLNAMLDDLLDIDNGI